MQLHDDKKRPKYTDHLQMMDSVLLVFKSPITILHIHTVTFVNAGEIPKDIGNFTIIYNTHTHTHTHTRTQ